MLSFVPNRNNIFNVPDEFAAGYSILAGGQLRTFLNRTTGGVQSGADDLLPENPTGDNDDSERSPSNPITSPHGVMGITPFIGEDQSNYN